MQYKDNHLNVFDPYTPISYNYYEPMQGVNKELHDLLAQARALHLAAANGAITYHQAKLRSQPILRRINNTVKLIAMKHKVKPKYITFKNLGDRL